MGSPSARAQENPDIAGTWDFTLESPQGKNTFLFIVKKDGEKLSGLVKSQRGERPVDNFALTGNDLTFTLTIQFQGADMLIAYKGTVAKDSMTGTADFGGLAQGPWSAVRHQETATGSSSTQPQADDRRGRRRRSRHQRRLELQRGDRGRFGYSDHDVQAGWQELERDL